MHDFFVLSQEWWDEGSGQRLTLNDEVKTSDRRISIDTEYMREFNLIIDSVRDSDAGTYLCIEKVQPEKVRRVNLILAGK